jgi:hypothetical protein
MQPSSQYRGGVPLTPAAAYFRGRCLPTGIQFLRDPGNSIFAENDRSKPILRGRPAFSSIFGGVLARLHRDPAFLECEAG